MKLRNQNSVLVVLLSVLILAWQPPARAAWVTQDDPAVQCERGVQLYLEGRYAEAMPLLEVGFAGRKQANFTDPDNLGLCALILGAIHYGLNDYTGAVEAYAVALEAFQSSSNRKFTGTTLTGMGVAYYSAGRFAEALDSYLKALFIAREMGDRKLEGERLNDIGVIYRSQGRYAAALEAMEQALVITRELSDRAGEARTLNNIGVVYDDQGNLSKALEVYQQALVIRREVRDRAGESDTLNNVGAAYLAQGRLGEALRTFEQALAIAEDLDDAAGQAVTLDNIGVVYERQGRYAEALEQHQQALTSRRLVGDRAGEGVTLSNIGVVLHRQGRYAEALEAFQQSAAIHRATGNRAGEGKSLHNMGAIYEAEGRYAEARDVYQQGLAIEREVGDRAGEAITLNQIGVIFAREGLYARAADYYHQALTLARETRNRTTEWVALANLGDSHQQQAQTTDALSYYAEAMDVFESMRSEAGSEAARASFMATHIGLYDRATQLYYEQGQDAQAFQTSERGRARAFLDSLSTGYVELSDNAAAELLAREQSAYATRQAAQDALARARGARPSDRALVADLEVQLAAAEEEYRAALAAVQARGDQLAALVPGRGGVLELSEVQALLDEQTTLVSYHVLGNKGSLAFVITRDDFEVVELPDATPERLRTAIADLSLWLKDNPENPHPLRLRNLYAWLVAPLLDRLHTPRVGIIPHQLLHYVPFSALTDGDTYLGQRFALFILPSASSLRFIQASAAKTPGASAVVFGNPETTEPDLEPLGYAEAEAKSIASLLHVSAAIGAEANEARLRVAAVGAGVVHLAAHGGYNTFNPLYSTIYLAPSGQASDADGRLEAHEVYGLDLKAADLVVLSACQSNVGELSAGDELVGLTRAFFFAGTPTVISSLWSVDDAATAQLMTAFYRHWKAGMGKAEALQAAQAEIQKTHPGPFFWAAFVLNGDPGQPGQGRVFGEGSVLGIHLPVHDFAPYAIITAVLLATTAAIVLLVHRRHH